MYAILSVLTNGVKAMSDNTYGLRKIARPLHSEAKKSSLKYPFDKLKAGTSECFVFSPKEAPAVRNALYVTAKKHLPDARFITKKISDKEIAVWRIK